MKITKYCDVIRAPDKHAESTKVKRDKDGKWLPGQSANPQGRPPLNWSWAELLREVGEEIEPKSGKQFKSLVSKRLWIECVNGNVGAIKELFNRMEGMPKQSFTMNTKRLLFDLTDDRRTTKRADTAATETEEGA